MPLGGRYGVSDVYCRTGVCRLICRLPRGECDGGGVDSGYAEDFGGILPLDRWEFERGIDKV